MQPPYVKIMYPVNNSLFQTTNIQINWTGSDNGSGLDHYEYSLDYGPWNDVGNITNITLSLSDGNHTFFIKAIDRMNNSATDSVNFVIDTQSPVITISSPANGSFMNFSNVTVEWNATDEGTGIRNYSVKLDGGPWVDKALDRNHTFHNLTQGWHNVSVRATDNANKSAVKNITFMIDLALPYVNITKPANNTIFTVNSVEVNWTGGDNESGLNHYEIKVGSGRWRNVGTDESHTFTGLSEGWHRVYIKAVDNASNSRIVSVFFVVDLSSPMVSITYPLDGRGANTTDVNVTWEGSDKGVGIDYYKIRIDNGTWVFVGDNTSYILYSLGAGSVHKIDVFAADKIGRNSTDSSTFTVDLYLPVINITSPQEDEVIPTDSVLIEWEGYDNITEISNYDIRIDDGNWSSLGKTTSYSFSGLEDGIHKVEVRATDEANNENISYVDFVVDTTPPTVSLICPSPYSTYNESSVYVEWIGNDTVSGLDHYEIKMKGGNWTDVGLNTSITLTGLSEGDYVVNIKAVDNAGCWAKDSTIFTILHKDTVPPSVNITSPMEKEYINSSTVVLEWKGSDDYSGIDHYEVKTDDKNWTDVGSNVTYEIFNLSNGIHTAMVKAVDGSGNENTDTVNFTVDIVLPELFILNPSQGTYINRSEVTVDWRGYDSISGIKEYYVNMDGGSWISVGNNTAFTFKNIYDGRHDISVKAVDNATNENDTHVVFTVDTRSPGVLSIHPYDGETDVNITEEVRVVFSEPMNSTAFAYSCSPDPGGWRLTWVENNTTVILTHDPFDFNTTYEFTISSACDIAGNEISPEPYNVSFHTEPMESSVSAPETISIHPYDGETDVNITEEVRVVFSEPMNSTAFAYSCSPDPGGWRLTWVENNTTVILTHDPFDFNTTYEFTISSARDLAGNSMEENHTVVFTTAEKEENMVENSTITGIVVDINENPISGASVMVDGEFRTLTGSDGSFSIEVSPGEHSLVIKKEGYVEKSTSLYVSSGEAKDLGEISLPPSSPQKTENGGLPLYLFVIIFFIVGIIIFAILKRAKSGQSADETASEHEKTGTEDGEYGEDNAVDETGSLSEEEETDVSDEVY